MEIIRSFFEHNLKITDFFDEKVCFMDIETTGFSRENDILYLIGIMYFKDGLWVLDQYFLNDITNERSLITSAVEFMNTFDTIINYNGNTFDLPFINTRAKNLEIDVKVNPEKSFDIYKIVKDNKNFLNLKNMKLKTIEESLGFFREDKYSGLDCIAFYKDYVVSGDKSSKDLVLKHNYDDLFHMLDIIEILNVIEDKKTLDVNLFKENYSLKLKDSILSGDTINIEYSVNKDFPMDIKSYNKDCNITTINKSALLLEIPLKKAYLDKNKLIFFLNLKEFLLDKRPKNYYTDLELPDFIYPIKVTSTMVSLNLIELSGIILNKLEF